MSLYSSWVTCSCFHFSPLFSRLSSARCSSIHTSLLPGLLGFLHIGRSWWFEAALTGEPLWAVDINTPRFHINGDTTSLIQLSTTATEKLLNSGLPHHCSKHPDSHCHLRLKKTPNRTTKPPPNSTLLPLKKTPKRLLKKDFGTVLFVLLRFIVHQCVV